MKLDRIDLVSTDLYAHGDPHAAWRWLRRNAPVYHHDSDDGGFWVLTKYADIVDAYLHPEVFSSAYGTMLGGSYRNRKDTASGRMLIVTDPPRHGYLRRRVYRAGFSPSVVARVRARVEECLDEALAAFVRKGGGDVATELSPALPTGVLAGIMGLPRGHARDLLRMTRRMIGFRDDEYRAGLGSARALVDSQLEIFEFFVDVVEQRRRAPGDDMISMLLESEINGEPLDDAEILYNCLNVAVGGNETTPHTASYTVLTFIEHPDEYERLLRHPELRDSAVEELFRWTSTNTYVQRTTMRPVAIRGRRIEAGESVTLWNSSANRDEDVFPDADVFDVGRSPNKHIAFGVARHRCIGASIAKVEIDLFVDRLLRHGLRFRLAGPVEKLHSNFMLGIRHLPVELIS